MINRYHALKLQSEKERMDTIPLIFAFSEAARRKQMKALGVESESELVGYAGAGYMRKSDLPKYHDIYGRYQKALQEAIARDKKGTGFLVDMFHCGLVDAYKENSFMIDVDRALELVNLTWDEVNNSPAMQAALERAMKKLNKMPK